MLNGFGSASRVSKLLILNRLLALHYIGWGGYPPSPPKLPIDYSHLLPSCPKLLRSDFGAQVRLRSPLPALTWYLSFNQNPNHGHRSKQFDLIPSERRLGDRYLTSVELSVQHEALDFRGVERREQLFNFGGIIPFFNVGILRLQL